MSKELREQEHNYEIVETENGFNAIPREIARPEVTTELVLDDENGYKWLTSFISEIGIPETFSSGLYDVGRLIQVVTKGLYASWKSPVHNPLTWEEMEKKSEEEKQKLYRKDAVYYHIKDWVQTQTCKTLAKKIRGIWAKKLEEKVDPEISLLYKKLFSAIGRGIAYKGMTELIKNKEEYKYLIKDLLTYNAARAVFTDWSYKIIVEKKDWKSFIGDVSNGCIRKTISNFPNGVPYYMHTWLSTTAFENYYDYAEYKGIEIKEPIYSRIRFFAYAVFNRNTLGEERNEKLASIILRSSDEQLKDAVRKYHESRGKKMDFRSPSLIKSAFSYMTDYHDEVGNWNIGGLLKRTDEYHRDVERRNEQRRLEYIKRQEEKYESPVAVPPVNLPEDNNIKFLSKYKDIIEEGDKMLHCVAGYADRALVGRCYLFHVDYENEMATVEVSPEGYVAQAKGPRNVENKATAYGYRVLSGWAKAFKSVNNESISAAHIPNERRAVEYIFDNYDEDIPF